MIGMKSIAVFSRFSGADRFKPIFKGANMNFLSADLDVCKPSVIFFGNPKDSMLMIFWHRFVFGVFFSINFTKVAYSVIKSVVVDVINNVRRVSVDIKPSQPVSLKMGVFVNYDHVASGYGASNFSGVSQVPPVIISVNKRFGLKYKLASIWVVIKGGFKFALGNVKNFHSMIISQLLTMLQLYNLRGVNHG